jgi:hypothetical protein
LVSSLVKLTYLGLESIAVAFIIALRGVRYLVVFVSPIIARALPPPLLGFPSLIFHYLYPTPKTLLNPAMGPGDCNVAGSGMFLSVLECLDSSTTLVAPTIIWRSPPIAVPFEVMPSLNGWLPSKMMLPLRVLAPGLAILACTPLS